MKLPICIAIVGPTASGKSAFASELATKIDGELVRMDSTTVYRGFDIGTAKPTAEERAKVPHHLVDILNPLDAFSAGHFVERAEEEICEIARRGKTPIVVGGTYFYLRALQHGMYSLPIIPEETILQIEEEFLEEEHVNTKRMHAELMEKDPDAAAKIHANDRYRLVRALAILRTTGNLPSQLKPVPLSPDQSNRIWMKYAITISRHALHQAIVKRTETMLSTGLIEEARALKENFPAARALGSIGYNEACQLIDKKLTEKQLRTQIIEKTRQLAKRQMTWLRSDAEIRFIDSRDLSRIVLEVENLRASLNVTNQNSV